MIKEIYLIRHGETEYNKLNRPAGSEVNIPLNDTGKLQALKTGQYLHDYRLNEPFDMIYSSPMIRTLETAEIIKEHIECDIIYDDLLIERRQGNMNLSKKDKLEIKKFKNELYTNDPIANKLNEDDIYDKIEEKFKIGKETDLELAKRCELFMMKVINSNDNKICIVTHGSYLTCLIRTIFKIPHITYGDNCCISYMTYDKHGFKLITTPNTIHLTI